MFGILALQAVGSTRDRVVVALPPRIEDHARAPDRSACCEHSITTCASQHLDGVGAGKDVSVANDFQSVTGNVFRSANLLPSRATAFRVLARMTRVHRNVIQATFRKPHRAQKDAAPLFVGVEPEPQLRADGADRQLRPRSPSGKKFEKFF